MIGLRAIVALAGVEKVVGCSYKRQLWGLDWSTTVVFALGIKLKSGLPVPLTMLYGVFQIGRATLCS